MKHSQIKTIKSFCANLFSKPDWRKVVDNIENGKDDFEVDNVRFISDDSIDQIQQDELANDKYILGCFNPWFVAEILGIDRDIIESMQNAEAYEAIGKLIISLGKLPELQEAYARADGYGHHFNTYDFTEKELTIDGDGTLYHVFDKH
jgi:hypothetical protein